MPSTAGLQKFQFLLYDRVAECALNKTEMQVCEWLNTAIEPDVPYEKLAKTKSTWSSINRKLIVALGPVLTGAFGRSITEEEAELILKKKRRLTALQILRRLFNHLQTNPEMKEVYGLQDLMAVQWQGDKNKALFRHNWSTKVLHLDGTVGAKVRTAFLLERMA